MTPVDRPLLICSPGYYWPVNSYPLVNIQKAIEAMAIEIVDFPMKNGDFPYVSLPEGNTNLRSRSSIK